MAGEKKKVVLAYSGGLDTSVIAKWLALKGFDVVCVVVDVGQREDLSAVEKKALSSGASRCIVVDARDEFTREFVFEAVRWNARYEGRYLLGTALARPVIARHLVRVAREVGARAVAHGATGKGNDQLRFELGAYALMPEVEVIAPWRDPEFFRTIRGREDAIAFAREHRIDVTATIAKPWSTDGNLMHISYEAGILEDPNMRPPDDMCQWTCDPKNAPDAPELVEIAFERGVPVAVDGKSGSPATLLTRVNDLGARHGIGRLDLVESRHVGMKSRGVYETPGGTILHAAHRDLECLCLDRNVIHLKETLMPRWAQLVYFGYWFTREMECLAAFLDESQRHLDGSVTLELYKGNVTVAGRQSPHALYDMQIASMSDDAGAFDPTGSTGFIAISALPLRIQARRGHLGSGTV